MNTLQPPGRRSIDLVKLLPATFAIWLLSTGPNTFGLTTITISTNVVTSGVKRFGINLGWINYFDSGQIMKNLVFRNPGFEGQLYQSIVQVATGGQTSFLDNNTSAAWSNGFWNGASYEVIWGTAKGRTGLVTSSTAPAGTNGVAYQLNQTGFAIATGDYIVLRKSFTAGATTGWTPGTTGGGTVTDEITDLPSGTEGRLAVRLSATGAGQTASLAAYFETSNYGSFVQLRGRYRLSFKAKGAGGANTLNCSVARLAPANNLFTNFNVVLTNVWRSYNVDFSAAEPVTTSGFVQVQFRAANQSALLLDDVSLAQIDGDAENSTAYRDAVVSALRDFHPGLLRYSNTQFGDSLDNQIASPFGRQRAGFTTATTTSTDIQFGLQEFLELCEAIGAEPWYSFPTCFSTQEITNLLEYLGGESTASYGAKRAARGHPQPWTSVFPRIHLEFGNEVWNVVDFNGETFSNPTAQGNRASELFGVAKHSAYYSAAKLNLVLGGQASFVSRSASIHAASTNHDTFAVAPYFGGHVDHFSNNEELFGTLLAESESIDGAGYMRQERDALLASSHPAPLAIYEVNLHTTDGTISQPALDSFTPSMGAGLAVAGHMLIMLRDLGIRDQLLYSLTQFANGRTDGKYVLLWGAVRDMGVTDRKRPQFLALQLANQAMGGDCVQTTLSGDNPTWHQLPINGLQNSPAFEAHYLQTFAFDAPSGRSVVVLNLHRTNSLAVNFGGTNAPTGNVTMKRLASSAITDNNESAINVIITTNTLTAFDPAQPLSLPPFSMTVLQWNSAHTPLRAPTAQRLRPPELLPGSGVRLYFGDPSGQSLSGADPSKFEVQISSTLTPSNWTRLTNTIVLTNNLLRIDDSTALGQPRRFYQVIENP